MVAVPCTYHLLRPFRVAICSQGLLITSQLLMTFILEVEAQAHLIEVILGSGSPEINQSLLSILELH